MSTHCVFVHYAQRAASDLSAIYVYLSGIFLITQHLSSNRKKSGTTIKIWNFGTICCTSIYYVIVQVQLVPVSGEHYMHLHKKQVQFSLRLYHVFPVVRTVSTSLKAMDTNPCGVWTFSAGCISCNMKWNQYGRHAETHSATHVGLISFSIHVALSLFTKERIGIRVRGWPCTVFRSFSWHTHIRKIPIAAIHPGRELSNEWF